MEYKIKEYHRDISNEELLKDLRRVSKQLNGKYVSRSIYEKYGKYSATPYLNKFGSWINVLKEAGLKYIREKNEFNRINDNEFIDDIKKVALKLNKQSISTKDYKENGKYSVSIIISRFGSWANVIKLAMLKPTNYKNVSDEDLFKEIMRLWELKGTQPTTTDIRKGKSIYALNTFARHFGGFRNALQEFIKFVNNDGKENVNNVKINKERENSINYIKNKRHFSDSNKNRHMTPREINLRLRYKVLLRDNFKCKICGASSSNDSSVRLHVDHIKPWSKGGETIIDNLQTLCSKCNLGKSDIE